MTTSSQPDPAWRFVPSFDGTDIAWRADGPPEPPAGRPAVVLCNGIGCDDAYWRDVWPALAQTSRVVRWHYRGHGLSGAPANPEEVIVASMVRDLVCVLDDAGVAAAVLVGHSFGVQVACEAMRTARERIAGLVAVAGAPGHPLGTLVGRNAGALLFPVLEMAMWPAPSVATAAVRAGLRSPLAYWVGRVVGGVGSAAPRDVMDDYFAHLANLDIPTMLRMFRAMQEHTAEDLLPSVSVPTVVLAGTADGMTPPRHARRIADAVPGARLREIDGATHVLPIEHPDAVVEETERVLALAAGDVGASA